MTSQFTYGTLNRPAMYATVPEGFTLLDSPQNDECVDRISYAQPLTIDQMRRYELVPISAEAYPFQLGDKVIVNECDDAIISGYETRGRCVVTYLFDGKTQETVKYTEIVK